MGREKGAAERKFRRLVREHGKRAGALIPLLQETQTLFGYLPPEALVRIARALSLSPSQVYGVATFYTQFRLSPVGRNIIKVCHGTACHVAGAERVSESLELALGAKSGGTTSDGKFTLEKVACLGCCSLSPVMMVNQTVHGKVHASVIRRILAQYP